MDIHTDYNELRDLFTDTRLIRIGTLAVQAFILARAHDAATVAERQNRVGPGLTSDSHARWMQASGLVQAEIIDAFGAAQIERDNTILLTAVRRNITDEHAIRVALGHELTDRDRHELARLRALPAEAQEFTLTPAPEPGVAGVTEKE